VIQQKKYFNAQFSMELERNYFPDLESAGLSRASCNNGITSSDDKSAKTASKL